MAMRPGELRHWVELQENTPTTDTRGHDVPVWATVNWLWVNLMPLAGRELEQARQIVSEVTIKVTARYDANNVVTNEKRFKHGSRLFPIRNVLDVDERNVWLECLCVERTDE